MRTVIPCLLAASLAKGALSQKVVRFDIQGRQPSEALKLAKRAAFRTYLFNDINNGLYSVNVSIGTPPQNFTLQLDTGSTDVWVNSAGSTYCQQGNCFDSFDSSSSSSYAISVPNEFNVTYGDGTGAAGDLFTDDLTVGGVTITNQTMGLASTSDIAYGLMGVGMVGTEGSCDVQQGQTGYCYANLIDSMVSEGQINSHAFSLYLNDLNQSTGSILFGGVDSSRYTGDLVAVPFVPLQLQDGTNDTSRYTVAWTNLTITTPNGVENVLNGQSEALPALLDSGTTLAILPTTITKFLFDQMGAVQVEGQAFAPCYLRTVNATVDFHLGGDDGAVIRVPIREFILDLDSELARIWKDVGGSQYCQVGIQASDDLPIFGDIILRSSYIVYDLDNRLAALAQAKYNPGSANVQEITNGTSSNIPGVARTASSLSISQVASATTARPGGVSATATDTQALSTASIVPLAQFTTVKYTGQDGYTAAASITTAAPSGTGSGSSSSSSGAANAVVVPKAGLEGVAVLGMVSLFMSIGAGMVLL